MYSLIIGLAALVALSHGHGLMIDPPARNTMWRYQFSNPPNYNDMGLNCGGQPNQWNVQGGKCGVCGDPYQGPRLHEAGYPGGYANGIIVRRYKRGGVIPVTARITANHRGYISFKICPVNDKNRKVTQRCLDRFPLKDIYGRQRFKVRDYLWDTSGDITVNLRLPPSLTCSQCVIQWKYEAGYNLGLREETFLNCADVSIQ